ncbi:MAG TPA: hypothetical protein VHO24_01205 [Opitutaceae bacterium]|nr:hypothetical protein [Opitutaceae bacterium]
MKTLLKVFTAVAAITFATASFAAEETVSLGYTDYYSSIEIDLREYGSGLGGSVVLSCNDELVFVADLGGVTYAAPGVYSWVDYYGILLSSSYSKANPSHGACRGFLFPVGRGPSATGRRNDKSL